MSDMAREYVGGYGFDGEPELTGEEIVRCRDCDFSTCDGKCCWHFAYYELLDDGSCVKMPADVEPDGFCSYGRRKEGGE